MTQLMEHAGEDGKLDFEEFVLLKLQVSQFATVPETRNMDHV